MNRRYFLKIKGTFFSNLLLLGSGGFLSTVLGHSTSSSEHTAHDPNLPVTFQFSLRYDPTGVQSDRYQNSDSIEQINQRFTKLGLILKRDKKESVDAQNIYHGIWTYEFTSVQAAHKWEKAVRAHAHKIWPRMGEPVAGFNFSIQRSYPAPSALSSFG